MLGVDKQINHLTARRSLLYMASPIVAEDTFTTERMFFHGM
jgi:hypothetical protein